MSESELQHSSKEENVDGHEHNAVSMVDIMEEEERLEADADAVLGDSDDKNCTYPQGYVKRQALYSCTTCGTTESAGICLACSYACHEGHELYELYTKRKFRCDCGNEKFPNQACKLYPGKDPENSGNNYNQNFKGVYCICSRPYPDEEDDVEDEMIQCVICEDWYHGRHLGRLPPPNQDYQEMICSDCMKKNDVLWAYVIPDTVTVIKKEENEQPNHVNVDETKDPCQVSSESLSDVSSTSQPSQAVSSPDKPLDSSRQKEDGEPQTPSDSETKLDNSDVEGTSSVEVCRYKELCSRKITPVEGAVFMSNSWRSKLCQCADCMARYRDAGIGFLLDEEDTVHAYEERGRAKHQTVTQQDQERQALSQMNRIQQVEVLQGFNDLKSELRDYLQRFAENGKVVREEDIKEFFTDLKARKKQRTAPGVQYFCK